MTCESGAPEGYAFGAELLAERKEIGASLLLLAQARTLILSLFRHLNMPPHSLGSLLPTLARIFKELNNFFACRRPATNPPPPPPTLHFRTH